MYGSTAIFLLLAASVLGPAAAHGQAIRESRIAASDGPVNNTFGAEVALDAGWLIVGARGTRSYRGAAHVYAWGDGEPELVASLTPEDTRTFGTAIALDAGRAVITAPGLNTGLAFIYEWDGTAWAEEARLAPLVRRPEQFFGEKADLDGTRVAVSGSRPTPRQSLVYVFERDGTGWHETARVSAPDRSGVAIDGDRLLAGNYVYEWDGAAWRKTAELDVSGRTAEAAALDGDVAVLNGSGGPFGDWTFVFERVADRWVRSEIQAGSNADVRGDRIAVGHPDTYDRPGATAHVFERDGAAWNPSPLDPPGATESSNYGWSVTISGERLVVGDRSDHTSGYESGAVYTFVRTDGGWTAQAKVLPPVNPDPVPVEEERFGRIVVLDDDRALVTATASCRTFVLEADGVDWRPTALLPPNPSTCGVNEFLPEDSPAALAGDLAVAGTTTYLQRGGAWIEQGPIPIPSAFTVDLSGNLLLAGTDAVQGAMGVVTEWDGTAWSAPLPLRPRDGHRGTNPSRVVAIDGDLAVISTVHLTCVEGCSIFVWLANWFYLFERRGEGWEEVARASYGRGFGNLLPQALDIDGNRVVASAGDSTFVFEWDGATLARTASLVTRAGAPVGGAVALEGDRIVVGNYRDHTAGLAAGKVHVFDRRGDAWVETHTITASDAAAESYFGRSVDVDGARIVVGAFRANEYGTVYLYDFSVPDAAEAPPGPSAAAPTLGPNYPSPFRDQTTVVLSLPQAAQVTLDVLDMLGRPVAVLVDGVLPAGRHEVGFDARGLASGLYVCRLRAGPHVRTLPMTLLR